jgi:hypothetical protein
MTARVPLRHADRVRALSIAASLAAGTLLAAALAPSQLAAFPDAPPARTTGGFGEDSCHACHFEHPENDGAGQFSLAGFPERYEPGQTYALALTIRHVGMAVAGFQLAIRHCDDGSQAGALGVPAAERSRVDITHERGITYAHHTRVGTQVDEEGWARWSIAWTAPAVARPVAVSAAAVAGDGDASQLGDRVYRLDSSAAAMQGCGTADAPAPIGARSCTPR